ncbi:hypothetical protein CHS0354_019219 [Potamilus streckersoni]|uniref:CS domain-containing protein n=1 Tax=Potamilus streckersoni TaxID=2493646 RepID=A0AAE0W570_9BIVA|nr:hypothetical protein CHS0354_019219 [Potamilus streckersoni]
MERYDERYDAALLGILQNEEKIEKFLHVIMGFLYRRTDFFRIMESRESKLGFPPGVARKILLNAFQHYEQNAHEDEKIKPAQKQRKKVTESESPRKVSDGVSKMNKSQSTKPDGSPVDENKIAVDNTKDTEISSNNTVSVSPESGKNESEDPMEIPSTDKIQANVHTDKSELKTDENSMTEDEAKLKKQQEYFQSKPDSYNGAVRDNYSWSQTITDVDVRVKVPSYIKKGKEVQVDLGKKHLKVSHKDQNGQWLEIVSGELTWDVHHTECIWSLVPGEHVHISMEKKQERWWEGLLTSEPKINVRSIDCSRPMSDLDDEAQAKIEEMMYNEQQKRSGLPQTHETKMHGMLKKAWDAEGSPFKGQPFDPSKFNIDPNGVMTMKDT